MSESTDQATAAAVERAVRAVPGVTALFRTEGVIAQAAAAGARLVGATRQESSPIAWERTAEGPRVEAAVSVDAAAGAAAVSRRVHAAIAEVCAERGCRPAEIRVTVVRVDDDL